jgi:DNA-binding PadR family transcriptional regulator
MKRNHNSHDSQFGQHPGRSQRDQSHHDPSARFHHDPSGHDHDHGLGHGFPGAGGGFRGGHGFGPRFDGGFGPRGPRRASKGDIRSAILSLLAEGPSNGYGLIKAIVEKTGGAWRPSPGSVYPTLQQLVDEELIISKGDGRKTEFELTDAGRSHVEEHAADFEKAWDATPGKSEEAVAFFESVGKLMGVVHQFRSAATDAQRAAAVEKLDETRRALYLILAD